MEHDHSHPESILWSLETHNLSRIVEEDEICQRFQHSSMTQRKHNLVRSRQRARWRTPRVLGNFCYKHYFPRMPSNLLYAYIRLAGKVELNMGKAEASYTVPIVKEKQCERPFAQQLKGDFHSKHGGGPETYIIWNPASNSKIRCSSFIAPCPVPDAGWRWSHHLEENSKKC